MRSFADGATIYVEPWRALVSGDQRPGRGTDRPSTDQYCRRRFVTATPGPRRTPTPFWSRARRRLGDGRRACIGCGPASRRAPMGRPPCSRPRKSRILGFPQGQPERQRRALRMVAQMDAEGLGIARSMANVGSVPEGDQHRHDRADEPRLHDRHDFAPPSEERVQAGTG
jgi:succinate dehydrogenase / fumarate reductase iron-sulfur subunit